MTFSLLFTDYGYCIMLVILLDDSCIKYTVIRVFEYDGLCVGDVNFCECIWCWDKTLSLSVYFISKAVMYCFEYRTVLLYFNSDFYISKPFRSSVFLLHLFKEKNTHDCFFSRFFFLLQNIVRLVITQCFLWYSGEKNYI